MALTKCPECGRQISNLAKSCPYCGLPEDYFQSQKDLNDIDVDASEDQYDGLPELLLKQYFGYDS